jgi:hypothetical protein
VASYFADTSFWIALSSKRDQYRPQAIAWHAVVLRSGIRSVTTEAVLWEWLNALASSTTRATAAEGYRRAHADQLVEVVPFDPERNAAAVELYQIGAHGGSLCPGREPNSASTRAGADRGRFCGFCSLAGQCSDFDYQNLRSGRWMGS